MVGCGYSCEQAAHTSAATTLSLHNRGPIPIRCTRTPQPDVVSSTPRPAPPAAQTSCCPQRAQALILLLNSLVRLFFRKRAWGRVVPHPRRCPGQTRVSLIPISFQDGVRRSTVVVRLPFRSSERITGTGVRRREISAPHGVLAAEVSLAVRGDEGTQ
jgi:hypothetical protein